MNLDLLLKLVREPASVEAENQADLEALVQEYPYFTAAHLLLLKLYKQQNSIHFNKQLRKVASLAPSREHVYDLVEVLPNLEEEPIQEFTQPLAAMAVVPVEQPAVDAEFAEAPEAGESNVDSGEAQSVEEAAIQIDAADASAMVQPMLLEESPISIESLAHPAEESLLGEAEATPEAPTTDLIEDELVVPAPEEATTLAQPEAPDMDEVTEEFTETALQAPIVETAMAEEPLHETQEENLPDDSQPESGMAPVTIHVPPMATEATAEAAVDFVKSAHDRLSWFRYFAGKPLREQPDDVLEQLYMEHMQQDLLQAPETAPETSIKAKVNLAEEVQSSVSMEEEIKRLAYDSISDDELPASETLARIYEQQSEYKRAIKIYQKLILKFPDKMTYFAGLIEELRKKV